MALPVRAGSRRASQRMQDAVLVPTHYVRDLSLTDPNPPAQLGLLVDDRKEAMRETARLRARETIKRYKIIALITAAVRLYAGPGANNAAILNRAATLTRGISNANDGVHLPCDGHQEALDVLAVVQHSYGLPTLAHALAIPGVFSPRDVHHLRPGQPEDEVYVNQFIDLILNHLKD
jgi:hypothetical protein